jgi:hypothetical protein
MQQLCESPLQISSCIRGSIWLLSSKEQSLTAERVQTSCCTLLSNETMTHQVCLEFTNK